MTFSLRPARLGERAPRPGPLPAAEQIGYGWGFFISGVVLLIAAVGWVLAPETRTATELEADLMAAESDVEPV